MELAFWQTKDLPVDPKRTLLLTDSSSFSISPIPRHLYSYSSSDSGMTEGNRTMSLGSPAALSPEHYSTTPDSTICSPHPVHPFHLQHLLISSGPGFSLGITSCGHDTDAMERLAVPLLQETLADDQSDEVITQSLELAAMFTMAEILCMTLFGENQLWIGTDKGTLHCFEIIREASFKLKQHVCLALNESLQSIAVRPIEYVTDPTASLTQCKGETLVGVPYGYIVILQGEVDQRGRLKDPLEKISRRIVRLTNAPTDCSVNCIVHVVHNRVETYWCSCGGNVIVLRSSDWQKIGSFDTRQGLQLTSRSKTYEVLQLLPTDIGVWSAVSFSSTVVLWDKATYSAKLHLTYCDPHRSIKQHSDISVLHYSHTFLFIGTQRGDLMVFKITDTAVTSDCTPDHTPPKQQPTTPSSVSYQFITNTHIEPHPLLNIYTTPIGGRPDDILLNASVTESANRLPSNLSAAMIPSSMYVLIVLGGKNNSTGQLHLYELSLSPPHSLRSSPTLSLLSNSTFSSVRSNSTSLTPQKLKVISAVTDYTPLRN